MGQIMALAGSLSGQSGEPAEQVSPKEEDPLALLGNMDPSMIQRMMKLLRTYNSGNREKTALLQAMLPFMREERRGKVEKAIRMARFSGVIMAAMEEFRGGSHV